MCRQESSHGRRINWPYKTVYEEYYQMDEFGLIGSVGGTLGMMIGFSFVSAITWTTDIVIAIKSTLKRKWANQRRDHEMMDP